MLQIVWKHHLHTLETREEMVLMAFRQAVISYANK